LYNVRLVIIILTIVLSIGILSCSNASVTTSPALKFALIPHGLEEPPMVPHPKQAFKDCALCHIDTSNIGSSIKIDKEHSCEECHVSLDYDGSCQETFPVNVTCDIDICHLYP